MKNLLAAMSRDLRMSEIDLLYLIRSAPHRYKVYEVPKRNGNGTRTIAQPAREVKSLQYWVINNILRHFPVHPAAKAYRRGKSILDNALPHADKRFLLKLDFKDFFHSIRAADFVSFMKQQDVKQFTKEEIELLTRILFWNKDRIGVLVLSIGAPSSPILSNLLMNEFDRRVRAYCTKRRIRYTRYADDLCFSTNTPKTLSSIETRVRIICDSLRFPRLTLNEEKTVQASRAGARRVTGLVLTNDSQVSIGHKKKRQLRAAVHHYSLGKLSDEEISALGGMLAFVQSVEPTFIKTLTRKYGRSVLKNLMKQKTIRS